MADPGNTAHHHEAMIVARQMTSLPSGSSRLEFRFGGGSVFGQLKPFHFFDLSASRSQSPITWLGIGSVSVTAKWGHRKSVWILRLSDAMATSAWDSESLDRRFESFQAHHFHRIHRVITLEPRDSRPLVWGIEDSNSCIREMEYSDRLCRHA